MVSDLADGLWQINEEINRRHGEILPLFDIGQWAELRQTIVDDLAAEKDDDSFPMKPQRILNDVRAFMGDNDILLSDVGAHKMWIARYYQCQEANTCLISNGFCTMGFAMPGALGAKMAFPDRKIMSISGDAGFLMNVQDLETAARLGLNTVNMVWLDGEYGLIKWKQQNHFDGKHSDLNSIIPISNFLPRPLVSGAECSTDLARSQRRTGRRLCPGQARHHRGAGGLFREPETHQTPR